MSFIGACLPSITAPAWWPEIVPGGPGGQGGVQESPGQPANIIFDKVTGNVRLVILKMFLFVM